MIVKLVPHCTLFWTH